MSETHDQFDRKMDRLIDGSLERDEFCDLEAQLLADPGLRRRFRMRARLEGNLHAQYQAETLDILPPLMQESRRPSMWRWPAIAGMAAALVMVAYSVSFLMHAQSPDIIATIESEEGSAWLTGVARVNGNGLLPGTMSLERGMASLRFESGAIAALEAPVTIELINPMRCRLIRGKAVFEVPDSAIGFVVETPNGYAVDHGTRFAVGLTPDRGNVEFGVLEGRISVHHDKTQSSQEVGTGGMVMLTPAGIGKAGHITEAAAASSANANLLRFRSRGRETSIVRGDMRDDFLESGLLMVKKDFQSVDDEDLEQVFWAKDRRSLIGFELDNHDNWQAEQARLRLNLVPSDRGYALLLPDKTTIEVYGIRDDPKLENWSRTALKWRDAPGSRGDSFAIDASEATLLGSFDIDRSYLSGPVVFESAALTRFVNEDRSGVVGLLLVSTSKPLEAWSLVHAFASSDHLEAAGPLLEITVK